MPITDAIRDLVIDGKSSREIHACASLEGMLTLRQAALLKLAQGRTTLEEVRRAVPGMPTA
jgi:type II secretory ATPase GspE/PulE/Tfp pilus assembly ATPase PilB-like protein